VAAKLPMGTPAVKAATREPGMAGPAERPW
jgi:hypothetical protein